MKAYCINCKREIEKPQWEHLIYKIRQMGGNVDGNICPYCKKEKALKYDFIEEKR